MSAKKGFMTPQEFLYYRRNAIKTLLDTWIGDMYFNGFDIETKHGVYRFFGEDIGPVIESIQTCLNKELEHIDSKLSSIR